MQFTPGTDIRQYRLIQRIGSGASGEVWEAQDVVYRSTAAARDSKRDPQPHRYAIKFMNERLLASANADVHRFRLANEVRALETLKSVANVPDLVDCDLAFFRPYVVMTHINGPAWDTLISSGEMFYVPMSRRLDLLQQVADTLMAIHRQGIIHRDIKPGNIHGIESPTILDFSIAVHTDHPAQNGTTYETSVGTGIYMPPLDAPLDVQADYFAFALVAYEMLFGQHAIFTPENIGDTVEETRKLTGEALAAKTWHLPSRIPEENLALDLKGADLRFLDMVFGKALGTHETRYEDLSEFIEHLRDGIVIPENEEYLKQHAKMSPPTPRFLIPQEKKYTVNEVQRSYRRTDHGLIHPAPARGRFIHLWVVLILLAFALTTLILALMVSGQL